MRRMKIQIFVIGLGIMMILGSGAIFTTGAIPGDSSEDPKTAMLGDNTGTIGVEGDTFYFRFTPSPDESTYKFSIQAGESTDLWMEIMVESTGNYLDEDYRVSSSRTRIVGEIYEPVIIRIRSYEGTTDFTLNIAVSSKLSDIRYSSELKQGDTFTWDILFERNDEPLNDLEYDFGFVDGDVIVLELLKDGDQISFFDLGSDNDYDNVNENLEASFKVSRNGNSSEEFFFYVSLLVQPTTYLFEDGTSYDLPKATEEGLIMSFFDGEYVQEGDEIVSIVSETVDYDGEENIEYEIRFDAATGLLNLIDWTGSNSTVSDHIIWQRRGIGLNRIPGSGEGLLADLPLSPIWVIFGLGLMTLYQRKRKL